MKFFKKLQKKQYISLAILAAMGVGVGCYSLWLNQPVKAIEYSHELSDDTALETRMLFAGDIYWGREMRIWASDWADRTGRDKYEYPFHKLQEFQPDLYDTWIGNLECPTIPNVDLSFEYEKETLNFNCPVEYLPHFAELFDIVSLANNHSYQADAYVDGYTRDDSISTTQQQLEKHNIQSFGTYSPHITDDICEIVSVPVRAQIDSTQQEARLPMAMCGYHGAYYTLTDKSLAVMQEYAKYMPVVAHPHMGAEYQAVSDEVREERYRKMIDNGADAVLGNHSHWIQPVEAYKGKLIAYSLGNFIFDQQFSNEVTRSAAIDLTLSLDKDAVDNETLRTWLAIGEKCETFKDDCLEQIKKKDLERLPLTFDYHAVGIDISEQITSRANQRLNDEILQRLEWDTAMEQLQ